MNLILFGPTGAGKGTQADKITHTFKLYKISSGDLLRDEINKKTNLGNVIKSAIDRGSLVSDKIINDLMDKILTNRKFNNKIIFDGYPRNLHQALNLDLLLKKHNQKISYVLSLNVDKEFILKRIMGRQTCTKCGSIFNKYFKPASDKNHKCGFDFIVIRSDDNEKTISKRYQTYLDKTLPILDHYKKLNLLHEIDGNGEIDQIFEKISRIIAPQEA